MALICVLSTITGNLYLHEPLYQCFGNSGNATRELVLFPIKIKFETAFARKKQNAQAVKSYQKGCVNFFFSEWGQRISGQISTYKFDWQLLWKLKAHFSVESRAIKPRSLKHSIFSGFLDHFSCIFLSQQKLNVLQVSLWLVEIFRVSITINYWTTFYLLAWKKCYISNRQLSFQRQLYPH